MTTCLLYCALCFVLGYAILVSVNDVQRDRTAYLKIPLLGLGIVGTDVFVGFMLGIPVMVTLILLALFAVVAVGLQLEKSKDQLKVFSFASAEPSALPLLILPVIAIGLVSYLAFLYEYREWDAFAIWGLKAKAMVAGNREHFADPGLAFSHLDYPLLFPAQLASWSALNGGADTVTSKFVCVFTMCAAVCFTLYSFRKFLNSWQAYVLAGILFTVPSLLIQASTGYADFTVFVFYLAAIHQLMVDKQDHNPWEAGILLAFLAYSKNEGLALAAIIAGLMNLRYMLEKRKSDLLRFEIMLVILVVPLIGWKLWVPDIHEQYASQLAKCRFLENLDRTHAIADALWQTVSDFRSWAAFWALLPVGFFAGLMRLGNPPFRRRFALLCLLLCAQAGLYYAVYLASPMAIDELLATTQQRLLLQAMPPVVYLWAWLGSELRSSGTEGCTAACDDQPGSMTSSSI